ncbi:hypothetical protein D9757_010414 [Collybiopsis confluens]|uniref:Nuclear fusion protein KAR5 n=1 Tax=Collybiopsis confluens TaxID=2823264 RepID=A0A8H5LTH6_9AGAR|nr:hypothetical protein D9757_010414 [Collybiopsis confluens]
MFAYFLVLSFRIGFFCLATKPLSVAMSAVAGSSSRIESWDGKQDALGHRSRRSDCFRGIAGSIRLRCAELDVNEEERVIAAISMTICELATANHHAPMECRSFGSSTPDGPVYFEESISGQAPADCVNALSRSAQFWSSYSGYLREIPMLRLPERKRYRSVNPALFDIHLSSSLVAALLSDNAKDIFRNISIDQELYLRMIIDRERANSIQTKKWMSNLDDLFNATDQLLHLSRAVQGESSEFIYELRRNNLETLDVLFSTLREFHTQTTHVQQHSLTKIDSALDGLSERHMQDLQTIVPHVHVALVSLLDEVFHLARQQHEAALVNLTTTAQDHWRVIYSEFAAMQETISQLSHSATSTALSLESLSNRAAEKTLQAHRYISESAHQLGAALDNLTDRTLEEIEKIDYAAMDLKQRLVLPPRQESAWFSYESVSSEWWWKGNIIKILGIVLGGAPLDLWVDSPFLRIFQAVWIVSFWLLKHSLSTVTSFIVLCLSCRKYIPLLLTSTLSKRASRDLEDLGSDSTHTVSTVVTNLLPPRRLVETPNTIGNLASSPKSYLVVSPQSRIIACGRTPTVSGFPTATRFSRIPDRLCRPGPL